MARLGLSWRSPARPPELQPPHNAHIADRRHSRIFIITIIIVIIPVFCCGFKSPCFLDFMRAKHRSSSARSAAVSFLSHPSFSTLSSSTLSFLTFIYASSPFSHFLLSSLFTLFSNVLPSPLPPFFPFWFFSFCHPHLLFFLIPIPLSSSHPPFISCSVK